MRFLILALGCLALSGCGVVYFTPSVNSLLDSSETKVRVIDMTPETVIAANRSSFTPQALPAIFTSTTGASGGISTGGAEPPPALTVESRPNQLRLRLPPEPPMTPYRIGVGDVVLLATPQGGNTIEELSGLLAAQNRRQGYTVQDDGAVAIPDVGRIQLSGMTLEEAEAEVFQALVANNFDPAFSLEISDFRSKRVSIGGAVASPSVVPITLTPLYLDEALARTGGIQVSDQDFASIRIYRDGTLYQIPLNELYSNRNLARIRLVDGDAVFVDTEYELDKARAYFDQQLRLAGFRQSQRQAALSQLSSEIGLRRGEVNEARSNFRTQLDLGAVERDYVYLTGEVAQQGRFALPFEQRATLADALFEQGGFRLQNANPRQIYVLRSSEDPREFGAVTAWQLDARNAAALTLMTRFEMRPRDIVFLAPQPVTNWNRAISQITPQVINLGVRSVQ